MLCSYETMRIEILKEYVQILKDELTKREDSKYGCSHEFVYGFEAAIQLLEEDAEANQ